MNNEEPQAELYDYTIEDDFDFLELFGSDDATTGESELTDDRSDEPAIKRRKMPRAASVTTSTDMLMQVLTGQKMVKSRYRRAEPTLYAFPSYDKCESLLFLPNAMSRYTNSGDFQMLHRLFATHLDRNCDVSIMELKPSASHLCQIFGFFTEIYPDFMICVHTSKVDGNKIHATMHSKHTECRAVMDSMRRHVNRQRQPVEASLLDVCTDESIKSRINEYDLSEAQRQQIVRMIDAKATIVVYLKIELSLTFDDRSRKVTQLSMKTECTSAVEQHL